MEPYNQMSIEELSINYPDIPWQEYLRGTLSSTIKFDENLTIVVKDPKFFSDFGHLIRKTPKRVLANYALWRNMEHSIKLLDGEMRKKYLQFETNVTGINNDRPRLENFIKT